MYGKYMLLTVAIFMCLLCMAVATNGNKRREAEQRADVIEGNKPEGEKKEEKMEDKQEKQEGKDKRQKGSKKVVPKGQASEMPSEKPEMTRSEDEDDRNNLIASLSQRKIDQKMVDKKARGDQFRMKQMYDTNRIEKEVAAELKQEELRKKHAEKHSEHVGKSAVDVEEPAKTIVNELSEGPAENDVEQTLDVEVPEVQPTVKHNMQAEEHQHKRKGKASVSTMDEQVPPKKQNRKKGRSNRPSLGGTNSRKAGDRDY